MLDLKKVMNGVSGSGFASGMAGGALSGVLAGSLMSKKGRKTAKKVLKVGGLAAAGALAWNAYQKYRQTPGDQTAAAPHVPDGGAPAPIVPRGKPDSRYRNLEAKQFDAVWQERSNDSLLLVQAMISAGMADGQLDRAETEKIFQQVNHLELSMTDKAQVLGELQQPLGAAELAAKVTRPETAIEVYAASLLAVDNACPEAREHLDLLAQELGLPARLVESMEQQSGQAPQPRLEWADGDNWHQRSWA